MGKNENESVKWHLFVMLVSGFLFLNKTEIYFLLVGLMF